MVALAEAVSVSRQTLYNRFESKEAVLEWATSQLIKDLRVDALSCFADAIKPTADVLLDAFCCWLCPIVRLLHEGRHGEEFLGLTAAKRHYASADPLTGFTAEVSRFLLARNASATQTVDDDLAFLLVMAAKGLMLTSSSEESFRSGMAQAIRGAGIAAQAHFHKK